MSSAAPRELLIEFYTVMQTIRRFEETAVDYSKKGIVIGNMHMYVGQEAVAAGVCRALDREDYVASTHRCDGHLIAKGADIRRMMAELMGRVDGNCGGRSGKMHQCAPEVGLLSANGIVGASLSLGTGQALYCSMYAPGRVAVAFFGDGAAQQGAFHENVNLAALWKLPAIYVCENNRYAISTGVERSCSSATIAQRAASYDIPGVQVDGNDVLAVYEAAQQAVRRARAGEGPTLIECLTYRLRGHHEGDEQTYRTREEIREYRENRCPIKRIRARLEAEYGWTAQEDEALRQGVEAAVEDAVKFGMASTPMGAEHMRDRLYA
jgi:TPP-dependent pyruvate/acetoin dehydrogenase alpha subunit